MVVQVCNLALIGTARKRYLLVPWHVAVACGMDEDSRNLVHAEDVLARLGARAGECWVGTIGADGSDATHNLIVWPMRMLHHVFTFRGEAVGHGVPNERRSERVTDLTAASRVTGVTAAAASAAATVSSPPPRQRQPTSACAIDGANEGKAKALYLGIGTYVFDETRMPQLLEALREASETSPSWRGHFRSESACREFTAWYERHATTDAAPRVSAKN